MIKKTCSILDAAAQSSTFECGCLQGKLRKVTTCRLFEAFKRRVVTFACRIVLLALLCASQHGFAEEKMNADKLVRSTKSQGSILRPAGAILPELKNLSFMEAKTNTVSIRFETGAIGTYHYRIAFLEKGIYAQPDILLDGKPVKPEFKSGKNNRIASFQAEPLPSGARNITLSVPKHKKIGILFLDWKIDKTNFKPIASASWKFDGNDTWRTFFHQPLPFAETEMILEADAPAEFFLNGISYGKAEPGKPLECTAKWHKIQWKSTTPVLVKTGKNTKFQLKTSPLGGCAFYQNIPDFLKEETEPDLYPKEILDNGFIRAEVAMPDPQKAFYRGPRFELAGIVTSLKFKGKEYFSRNYLPGQRNPRANDQVAGQAEEFYEPIGFQDAAVGQPFLKIGNGLYEKTFASNYFFGTAYKPIKMIPWTFQKTKNKIRFQQIAPLCSGYAYEYTKDVELIPGKPILKISYQLKNTGERLLETSQYAHNFILYDNKPVSDAYQISFPFRPMIANQGKDPVKVIGKSIHAQAKKTLGLSIQGIDSIEKNVTKVTYLPEQRGVVITEDFIPYQYTLFLSMAICPESFKLINLPPGKTTAWSRTYTLF